MRPWSSTRLPITESNNVYSKRRSMGSITFARPVKFLGAIFAATVVLMLLFSGTKSIPTLHSQEDSDPLACARSHDGKRPVEQYVVMIDAGSSGSRVHVYHFNNCRAMPRLVNEEFKMIDGGLSSYAGNPEGAARSLDPLLQVALDAVPEDKRACTPIAVKATAGLRKLGEKGSELILDAVRRRLESEYPFPISEHGVEIMSGEDEGVYAWVTANFLLERIGSPERLPTVAVFDLGGGSTQIVFEPVWKDPSRVLADGDHKYQLSFGGLDFTLYQHSYLGYGLNEVRQKINSAIALSNPDPWAANLSNPCLPPGTTLKTMVLMPERGNNGANRVEQEVTFVAPELPSHLQCRSFAEKILEKDAVCANPPCAFSGVHQPPLFESFPADSDMYVFSFFYDRIQPLGMPSSFTLDELRDLADKVCRGRAAYSSFAAVPGAIQELERNPQHCLDLTYMYALLRTGYDIKAHREVRIAKKINNMELGWCLGASLPMLDGLGWSCNRK